MFANPCPSGAESAQAGTQTSLFFSWADFSVVVFFSFSFSFFFFFLIRETNVSFIPDFSGVAEGVHRKQCPWAFQNRLYILRFFQSVSREMDICP